MDIDYNKLDEEENNMVSIYQEEINKAAAKVAAKVAAKAAEKAAAEARTDNTFELAMTLSKGYNRSFESILDDFKISPEEKNACMEKYKAVI